MYRTFRGCGRKRLSCRCGSRISQERLRAHTDRSRCCRMWASYWSGSWEGFSTQHPLAVLASRISNGLPTVCVTLDIAKAFDCVWHNALIYKLSSLGFSNTLVRFFTNFLDGRCLRVTVNGAVSSSRRVMCGVPQGAASAPYLFLIFAFDIPRRSTNHLAIVR